MQTHQVKKFVLHTNPVGHVDFNLYIKCNFVIFCREEVDNTGEAVRDARSPL